MKFTKILGVAAVAALALMAFASSALASTTLETNGVRNTGAVTISASASGSIELTGPFNELINTCTSSNVTGTTSTTTGTRVAGPISTLSFSSCTREKVVVDNAGSLEVENIAGTTNGTVFSKSAEVTTPSPFGTLNCKTASTGTDIGTFTGVKSGTATMDIDASLNCSGITGHWVGKYTVTSGPNGVTT